MVASKPAWLIRICANERQWELHLNWCLALNDCYKTALGQAEFFTAPVLGQVEGYLAWLGGSLVGLPGGDGIGKCPRDLLRIASHAELGAPIERVAQANDKL